MLRLALDVFAHEKRDMEVIASTHMHLDHHNCLEVIILRGKVREIEKVANNMACLKGVKLSKVNFMTTGEHLV